MRAIKITKDNILIKNVCDSAFLSRSALIGATRLKTNLNIKESNNRRMIVGKIKTNPFKNVLIKNPFDQNRSEV